METGKRIENLFSKDDGLKNQINHLSLQSMDKIAEGLHRSGNKDFIQFQSFAKTECDEFHPQLYRLPNVEYISNFEFKTSSSKPSNPSNQMNKLYTIVAIFLLLACSPAVIRNDASVGFGKEKHDFGTIAYKKEANYSFEFTNMGKTPLIISEVKTSCGCTVPEWPKLPIRPGGKDKIKITYDAAFLGVFHKTIEVFYNGAGSPASLEIKGEVEYPEGN